MKKYYQEQLAKEKVELEYIAKGVVVSVDRLIYDYQQASIHTPLSIESTMALVDNLNTILDVYFTKVKNVAGVQKALDDYIAKNGEDK
ncbi:MAG: hypothetical protein K2M89_06210 [Clostridiales bacterium]|nr:hypothetical protein [Clostridiales bacterium]